jgi:hypothetical protein
LIENSTNPLKISNQRNREQKNSKINQFYEKCQRDVGRFGKIWKEFKCSKKVYFHTKRNIENVWTTGIITEPKRRNILEINYGKLREVIKIENQTRVLALWS